MLAGGIRGVIFKGVFSSVLAAYIASAGGSSTTPATGST
jgi:hypothetical protein